jgi:hypothetical protein
MKNKPGWDAKTIHEIARMRYGGLVKMFEQHGWPERGPDMMRKVQSYVVKCYGNVRNFEQHHRNT